MRNLILVLSLVAIGGFTVAACGGDDEDGDVGTTAEAPAETTTTEEGGGAGGGGAVSVTADPGGELAYVEDSLSAEAGEVSFELDNPSGVPHDFNVEDPSGETIGGTEVIVNDTTSTTLDLESGEYTFYCSVASHREAGMEGPLTVE